MSYFRNGILVVILLFSVVSAASQESANLAKWLKIKVFESTREDVEKLYGTSNETKYHFIRYKNSDGTINVDYSKGGCEVVSPMWNVPEWTVIEISYTPWKNPPKLKDLIPDKSRYKRKQAGDVLDHIEYYDEEKGISVIYDKVSDEVRLSN